MFIFESAVHTLKKYADFSGRASRSEFWCFFLFVLIVQAAARVVDSLLGRGFYGAGPVSALTSLLLIVPQVAVAVRRLHDVGRSGRDLIVPGAMLLAMPVVFSFRGILPQLVALGFLGELLIVSANLLLALIKQGRNVPNKYGASPVAFSFAR